MSFDPYESEDELSDEGLMADVAEGSRPAFDRLSRRHAKRCLALALRIVRNTADAEEIVQDAFLHVWIHADRWRPNESRFVSWLYRILLNRCLDYRRKRVFAPIEDAAELASLQPDPFVATSDGELMSRFAAALADLGDRQRAAFTLVYFEEMTCAEAGRVLDLSESATESLLVRARKHLRARLLPLVGLLERSKR